MDNGLTLLSLSSFFFSTMNIYYLHNQFSEPFLKNEVKLQARKKTVTRVCLPRPITGRTLGTTRRWIMGSDLKALY